METKPPPLLGPRAGNIKITECSVSLDIFRFIAILPPMKPILLALAVTAVLACVSSAVAGSLYDIPLKDINGNETSLKQYRGKVLLIVNVASKCGYTPQYKSLEAIYEKYKDQGFLVLGFPCNDFGGQEPGTNEQIKEFCSSTYGVTFPMFDKLHVKPGPNQHALFAALTGEDSAFPGQVTWNFNKFLISRDGRLIARFDSKDKPDSEKVTKAIEAALKAQ